MEMLRFPNIELLQKNLIFHYNVSDWKEMGSLLANYQFARECRLLYTNLCRCLLWKDNSKAVALELSFQNKQRHKLAFPLYFFKRSYLHRFLFQSFSSYKHAFAQLLVLKNIRYSEHLILVIIDLASRKMVEVSSSILKNIKEYFECPVCYNIPRWACLSPHSPWRHIY